MFARCFAVAIALFLPASAAADEPPPAEFLAKADMQRGERIVSRQCAAACHTYEKDGKPRVGPNLWDVVGQKMAAREDYRYSAALRRRAEGGGLWTYEALDAYLAAPQSFLPGTSMTFVGLKRPQDRADVILYLRSLSDAPQPLPDAQ